jgi:predicted acyltransferase
MVRPERIIAVDFLRGLTVVGMILVNNPGSWEYIYPPFQHSHWNGCTPTDLVFPFFLFIMGISIAYSLDTVKYSTDNQSALVLKIIKRSILLFLLGLVLNIIPDFDFSSLRIPGVLQRIAIVFFVSALLFLKTSVRTQIIISILLLIFYWIIMTVIPVPGIGAANLEPGTNLSAWLDNTLLKGHLWRNTKTWDPEGFLSTVPSIVSGLAGVLAGTWLKTNNDKRDKIIYLFVAANALIVLGLAWDMVFPINKSLWTSSFVVYTSGIALTTLAVCFWLIDVREYKKYTGFFLAFGSNAIAAYILAELLAKLFYSIKINYHGEATSLKTVLFELFSFSSLNLSFVSFVLALLWVALIWIPISLMYKRKIFIKV